MKELITDIIELENKVREIITAAQGLEVELVLDEQTIRQLSEERLAADGGIEKIRRRAEKEEEELIARIVESFNEQMERLEANFAQKSSGWEKEIYEEIIS